ncbi:unnamed protein product, partial [marine sediment metagenome]
MVMKRGFLHVVEVIIVVIVALALLLQFASIPRMEMEWSDSKLILMSQDLLHSLDESDVNWFSASDVQTRISAVLPETMGFTLHTRQEVRPLIKIGCVCDSQQFDDLEENLTDFSLNGIDRRFEFERIEPSNMKFPVPGNNDVIFFWGVHTLNAEQLNNFTEYMRMGKGVVELSALPSPQEYDESWHGDIFNLELSDSLRPSATYADFPYFAPTTRGYQ